MFGAIDQGAATLVAAATAAGAALLSLLTQIFGDRRAEMRAAHRSALAPDLALLGEAIHEIMAFTVIMRKRAAAEQDAKAAIDNARRASASLKQLLRKTRYTLPGLQEPLRVISRLPDWAALQRGLPNGEADVLIEKGQALQKGVDHAIQRSYRKGMTTGWLIRYVLNRRANAVRELHENRYAKVPPRGSGATHRDVVDPVA